MIIQSLTFLTILTVALWRKLQEDATTNLLMAMNLIFVHFLNGIQLFSLAFTQASVPSLLSSLNFLGLVLLDLLLIAGNLLDFKMWKRNFLPLLVYALGVQVDLLTYAFTKE